MRRQSIECVYDDKNYIMLCFITLSEISFSCPFKRAQSFHNSNEMKLFYTSQLSYENNDSQETIEITMHKLNECEWQQQHQQQQW
jgi:hypothetical protein